MAVDALQFPWLTAQKHIRFRVSTTNLDERNEVRAWMFVVGLTRMGFGPHGKNQKLGHELKSKIGQRLHNIHS